MTRLAVVLSHPIQYYSPWFRWISSHSSLVLRVFYLWDFGVQQRCDPGFQKTLQWDLDLLEGYASTFVANRARDPGTHHFGGLDTPELVPQLLAWQPEAVLLFGYPWRSHLQVLLDPRLWRIPILLRGDSHGLLPHNGCLTAALATALRRLLFRRFSAALPVGQANAAWLSRNGIPRCRQFLAPHAVDNARFQAAGPGAEEAAQHWRHQLGISAAAPVVLFAGKFERKKRPLDLLEAFAQLRHASAVLVFVGSGHLEGELRRRAAAVAPGRVLFQGFQNQSAMPRTYALGDLLVLPSCGPGETWGLCVNEAMNLSRPVLVSSHVGCGPDLVIPGKTGWIFPAGDVPALRAALSVALSDPVRLKAMGKAARVHINHYSYTQATAGLVQALSAVVPSS